MPPPSQGQASRPVIQGRQQEARVNYGAKAWNMQYQVSPQLGLQVPGTLVIGDLFVPM